jgi:hypothetical protein
MLALAALFSLTACGGGGGDDNAANPPAPGSSSWIPGVFMPATSFAAQCIAPRTGTNPSTGVPYADVQGTVVAQNNWLRSWSNELYLWYSEITDLDPGVGTTAGYFEVLKTFRTTGSGAPVDRFHFTIPTTEWLALAQSGVSAGYGAEWTIVAAQPPREVLVAYTQPGSPATAPSVNLQRGAKVLTVDGVDVVNGNTQASVDALNAGLFPTQAGQNHVFTVQDRGSSTSRSISMQSANVTSVPVQHVRTVPTPTGPVGYLLFTDHIATAEQALIDAIDTLRAANITDLVLDIRYNGGGFLDIASELAYMIAGPAQTAGQTFEDIRFSDKHPATNPVTRVPLTPVPFHSTARGFSTARGQTLPTLSLSRVFVLTGPNTCSASESIINGLRGVNVQVIQIGSTTCGKPYGSYQADNCGTTYFSIQFKGVNAIDFGDYGDGFSPSNTPGGVSTPVPGCSVADDFSQPLGNPLESRLAAALAYRQGQTCPAPSGSAHPQISKPNAGAQPLAIEGVVHKSPWLQNRTLSDP